MLPTLDFVVCGPRFVPLPDGRDSGNVRFCDVLMKY